MGWIKKLLNVADTKTIEQLQEQVAVQELLLDNMQVPKTEPSEYAREQKKVADITGTVAKRVPVRNLQHLYLNNQFIFRGVNVRADELITRGYKLIDGDDIGTKSCQNLIDKSGGDNLFWQTSINCDTSGDAYLEKIPNVAGTSIEILRHVNPVNFGFLTDLQTSRIILNEKGLPKAYMQKVYNDEGKEETREIEKKRISHLVFNTFADEFNGISSLQPVYNTAIRLMNMEQAAAESAVKTANPLHVVTTSSKSPVEVAKWARLFGRISGKEQITLPAETDLKTISPGNQNFNDYAEYFLDAVVAALGVPKIILTGISGSGSGNRSTGSIQSRHFYSVIRANQRYMERVFNEVFEDYGTRAGFKAPKLRFNDIAEDAATNSQWAIELYNSNLITLGEARGMVGLELPSDIKKDLEQAAIVKMTKLAPNADSVKKDEKETFHPADPKSGAGSQAGQKAEKKVSPDVKSVV